MIKEFWSSMCSLPSIEHRQMIGEPLRSKMFGINFSPENNASYIFYLVYKNGLISGLLLSLLLWFVYKHQVHFSFLSFDFSIPDENFIRRFSGIFSASFSFIQFFFIFPFFYMVFRRNIDWNSFSFLGTARKAFFPKDELLKRLRAIRAGAVLLVVVNIFGAWGVGVFVADRLHLHNSKVYLISLSLLLPVMFSYLGSWTFRTLIIYLKCRDDYYAARIISGESE